MELERIITADPTTTCYEDDWKEDFLSLLFGEKAPKEAAFLSSQQRECNKLTNQTAYGRSGEYTGMVLNKLTVWTVM